VTISLLRDTAAGTMDLSARIEAQIGGIDRESAQKLLAAAHDRCPYSRATRGNIVQEVVLVESEAE
jgi:osmotically inducible protein OsmC